MRKRIDWKQAILISGVSAIVSLILFILTEIIWGDILKEILISGYKQHFYSNINYTLVLGLLIVFGVSLLTNIFIYHNFTLTSRVIANLLALAITIILLFFISWVSVIALFADQYQNISFWEKIRMFFIFFAYFGTYVLPNPVWFWIFGLIIYHIALIVFIKLFFTKKLKLRKNPKRIKHTEVYSNKNSII